MSKKLLTIISILLFSTSAVIFANDISETVQTEQEIEQKNTANFKSDYEEYSMAEKDFASKYNVNPRKTSDVWFKYKSLINAGIGMAIGGGLMYTVGTPTFLGIGIGILLVSCPLIVPITMWILSSLIGLAGIIVQSLCAVPFSKSAILSAKYKKLYNVKLKHAAAEANILSMHDCENKEIKMAVALGIK